MDEFNPDYSIPPGHILKDELEERGILIEDFVRKTGQTQEKIDALLRGDDYLDAEMAQNLEGILDISSSFWCRLEEDYRQRELCQEMREMKGYDKKKIYPKIPWEKVKVFFSVNSFEDIRRKFSERKLAYRHTPTFKSKPYALACYIQMGENAIADKIADKLLEPYDAAKLKGNLPRLKVLSLEMGGGLSKILSEIEQLCNESGVFFVSLPSIQDAKLSGVTWWTDEGNPVIQLSLRHKTDDHFWFSLFHELAHVYLHSGKKQQFKTVFDDASQSNGDSKEDEADKWARDYLIDPQKWNEFCHSFGKGSKENIEKFAKSQGISAGIVVGRLQKEGYLLYNKYNGMKNKLK